jgi:hypothetical protein
LTSTPVAIETIPVEQQLCTYLPISDAATRVIFGMAANLPCQYLPVFTMLKSII